MHLNKSILKYNFGWNRHLNYGVVYGMEKERKNHTPGLLRLFILSLTALALTVGCRALSHGGAGTAATTPYTLYVADNFVSRAFHPVDEARLDDRLTSRPLDLQLVAADSQTGITVEASAGRANPDPQTVAIIVRDLPDGAERARFHPPVGGLAAGLSADGRRLLWQPIPLPAGVYPPPVEWYVLDTADGSVIGHIIDEDNACFRQSALLAPDGGRLYCMVDPALHEISGPQPVRIVVYEVGAGASTTSAGPIAGASLETRIGQKPLVDAMGWELLEPALSLSPDGATLAVVHADADQITFINAADLTLERTITLEPAAGLWDWLGLGVRTAQAKGEMEGVIRHAAFGADGRQLYVFSQVLTRGDAEPPAERGLWRVDLERGQIAARALGDYQIQWLLPAPDGTLFAFGTKDTDLHPLEIRESSPSTLWRLDGQTLEVLTTRDFSGYRAGRLVAQLP